MTAPAIQKTPVDSTSGNNITDLSIAEIRKLQHTIVVGDGSEFDHPAIRDPQKFQNAEKIRDTLLSEHNLPK